MNEALIFNLYVLMQKKYSDKWELKRALQTEIQNHYQKTRNCSPDVLDKIITKNVCDYFNDKTMQNLKLRALDYDIDLDTHFDLYTGQNYKDLFYRHLREMLKSIENDMNKCILPHPPQNNTIPMFLFLLAVIILASYIIIFSGDDYAELSFMEEKFA